MKGKHYEVEIHIKKNTDCHSHFFGITILAYFILNMAPGSPLDALLADPGITPAELERKRVALGLDQPVIIQYFTWLKQLLTEIWDFPTAPRDRWQR